MGNMACTSSYRGSAALPRGKRCSSTFTTCCTTPNCLRMVLMAIALVFASQVPAWAASMVSLVDAVQNSRVGLNAEATEREMKEPSELQRDVSPVTPGGDSSSDADTSPGITSFNLQNLQVIVDELKEERTVTDGSTSGESKQESGNKEGAETLATKQKVKEFVNSEGVDMEAYVPGSQGAYLQKALKKFYHPQSLLEPSKLKAYFFFHIGIIENTGAWLSRRSKYYRKNIEPAVTNSLNLANTFAASLEIVLAEALTEIENLERLRLQTADRKAFEHVRENNRLGVSVSRLREITWKLDAVLGEVSGTIRAYKCPPQCVSLSCRWTCEMKKTLPAEVESLAALTTHLASIFETIQEFVEKDADVGLKRVLGRTSTFERREAEETFERHANALSSSVEEFQRLLKGTGENLLQIDARMQEFTSLLKNGRN